MDAGAYVYDEDEPEEAAEVTGQELMEIDGEIHIQICPLSLISSR